ncbi:ClpP/crotonase [Tilletiaria anomala UBC 951]|uniref:ClpP/crotonase n=1 Tax=Tilletiaria anomala (strain ATCC 24038 / CBS 436.72 / UBC 951) TaxID=1037660 RepID=A0A066W0X2_TILAU|nr:ClpP/crotonase [Tilletiaria anomala UBC 951]KDN47341.1 ClpP/crotonase [Tilletiaria anomala UBC 951]
MSARHPLPASSPLLAPTSKPISLSFPNPTGKPEHEGIIAVLTLDAPEKLNAMRYEDTVKFVDALQWIASQDKVVFTVITGKGRFFSAGADVNDPSRGTPSSAAPLEPGTAPHTLEVKKHVFSRFSTSNLAFASALHSHPKILIGALNGPAIGIFATLLGHCDLIYSFKEFWLSTPFMGLALVSEGAAALAFAKKMGLGRAQVALLEGKKMEAEDLRQCGFITHIFPTPPNTAEESKKHKHYTPPILDLVLSHLSQKFLPPILDPWSLLYTKELIRAANYDGWDLARTNMEEIKGAEQVFMSGRPQRQFERISQGGRHKL